jgi:hypothetical protein
VDTLPVPDRAASYGAEVWRQLQPQLADRKEAAGNRWFDLANLFRLPRLAFVFAIALIAVGAFVTGRMWQQPSRQSSSQIVQSTQSIPTLQPLSAEARQRVLLAEIGDHLERSQLALVELINSRTNGPVDISTEQILARELIAMNRLFRRAASDAGEPGMASVMEDVELVLVEVANGPSKLSADEFAELRQHIGSEDLLFKVKVVTAQVRAREQDLVREMAAKRS